MNNEINVRTLCTGVYDERANDKEAISGFLSDTSAIASGSILYLYERMNARRCKISFLSSLDKKEDKGDREGIPHTHPIP